MCVGKGGEGERDRESRVSMVPTESLIIEDITEVILHTALCSWDNRQYSG